MTTATKASETNAQRCPRCGGRGYVPSKSYLSKTSGTTTFKACPEWCKNRGG